MNIGLVLARVPGYSETFIKSKIKGLREAGNQVIIFSNSSVKSNFNEEVKVIYGLQNNLGIRGLIGSFISLTRLVLNSKRIIKFSRILSGEGYNLKERLRLIIINAHILPYHLDWLHFGFATLMLEREYVAKAIGAKMGVSFRGYDINVYPLKNPGCYKKAWSQIDKVHSISNALYQCSLDLGLAENIKYELIAPAINLDLFTRNNRDKENSLSVEILTVGRLSWIKGLDYALHAMTLLKHQGILFKYTIVGDGEWYERLKFAIYQLDLCEEVILAGKKKQNEIIDYYKKSDIYIQPSLNEGFCNAIIEAQASGCLSIASDVGGLSENIVAGKTGWLVPPRNPQALCNQIIAVFSMEQADKEKIRSNARKHAETQFDLKDQVRLFTNFFE